MNYSEEVVWPVKQAPEDKNIRKGKEPQENYYYLKGNIFLDLKCEKYYNVK